MGIILEFDDNTFQGDQNPWGYPGNAARHQFRGVEKMQDLLEVRSGPGGVTYSIATPTDYHQRDSRCRRRVDWLYLIDGEKATPICHRYDIEDPESAGYAKLAALLGNRGGHVAI